MGAWGHRIPGQHLLSVAPYPYSVSMQNELKSDMLGRRVVERNFGLLSEPYWMGRDVYLVPSQSCYNVESPCHNVESPCHNIESPCSENNGDPPLGVSTHFKTEEASGPSRI